MIGSTATSVSELRARVARWQLEAVRLGAPIGFAVGLVRRFPIAVVTTLRLGWLSLRRETAVARNHIALYRQYTKNVTSREDLDVRTRHYLSHMAAIEQQWLTAAAPAEGDEPAAEATHQVVAETADGATYWVKVFVPSPNDPRLN